MLNDKQKVFVDVLKKEYPDAVEVRRGDLNTIHKKHKLPFPYWLVNDDKYKAGKGMFKVPVDGSVDTTVVAEPNNILLFAAVLPSLPDMVRPWPVVKSIFVVLKSNPSVVLYVKNSSAS